MTIEELFGTLQQSIIGAWRKHLRTSKYSKHMALDEFYTEMPEKVDALIEAWMGVNGRKPKSFDNLLSSKNLGTLDYLKSLRKVVKDGYMLMEGEPELEACLDDIAELIDSTIYKIKELSESEVIDLKDYINEALNEGMFDGFKIRRQIVELQGAVADLYEEMLEKNPNKFRSGRDVMMFVKNDASKLYDKIIKTEGAISFNDWWKEFSTVHSNRLDRFFFNK